MAKSRVPPRWPATRGLNPALHGLLASRVGPVELINEGVAATPGTPASDPRTGKIRSHYVDLGEYLCVSCPFCDDTRHRLWISHLWCTPDPLTGEPLRHLAHCYNEDCLRGRYLEFEERVFGWEGARARRAREAAMGAMRVRPGVAAIVDDVVELPGECVPVDMLEPHHPAVAYLRGRGLDPGVLAKDHEVCLCTRATSRYVTAGGRLVVPVRAHSKLVGWQARFVGNLDWKAAGVPKYYTRPGFKKSHHLYNLDRASRESPRLVLVVEGVTDVWAAAGFAVTTFGKTISPAQHKLLAGWADRGGLCLLGLDPGAWTDEVPLRDRERAQVRRATLLERLRVAFSGRFVEITWPDGKDPGSLGAAAVADAVTTQMSAAGFDPAAFQGAMDPSRQGNRL